MQLLQLVHGRVDSGIRDRSTIGALDQLAQAGYVARDDAASLAEAYRFLRTLEHRLQLIEEEQVHAVPVDAGARRRIALVMGYGDDAGASATAHFDEALRNCQRAVRAIHERLFFRPLLEAFAAVGRSSGDGTDIGRSSDEVPIANGPSTPAMSAENVALRLTAFGFRDATRTRAAVEELASGLTRSSRLMAQLLPLLLDWLSLTPDPDLGLLGLRTLVVNPHARALLVSTFRESPEAARRVCLLLGSSRSLAEALVRNPELIAATADDAALEPTRREPLVAEVRGRISRDDDVDRRRSQLVRVRQDQLVRIAARDLLDLDDVGATGRALTDLSEALLEAALESLAPAMPFTVIGMGRFGGQEMAYASDLDILFVYEDAPDADGDAVVEALLQLMHGPVPAGRVATLDLGLRPEGGQGRLARDLHGYGAYFERWAQTWERQALLRARVVAGDRALGERFMQLVGHFVWDAPLTDDDVADIRRMKARIERERIPARDDPEFHLKLGRGVALRRRVDGAGLLQLLHHVARDRHPGHAARARDSWCARGRPGRSARGVLRLLRAHPRPMAPRRGAARRRRARRLPAERAAVALSRILARSLQTTPAHLRDDYRRVTRRARRVVERAFYGLPG